MTRRASDTLGPDGFDVDAATQRGKDEAAAARGAAARMTEAARREHQQRREDTRDLRGGQD